MEIIVFTISKILKELRDGEAMPKKRTNESDRFRNENPLTGFSEFKI